MLRSELVERLSDISGKIADGRWRTDQASVALAELDKAIDSDGIADSRISTLDGSTILLRHGLQLELEVRKEGAPNVLVVLDANAVHWLTSAMAIWAEGAEPRSVED